MNEEQKPYFDPYASWGDQPKPETPVTETPTPEAPTPEAPTPETPTPETPTEALAPETTPPPPPPRAGGYGTAWENLPPETGEGEPGRKLDFVLAFVGTVIVGIMGAFLAGVGVFVVGGVAIALRFVLQKQNRMLAKGFMWGGVTCIALPLILLALLFGSCLLMLA